MSFQPLAKNFVIPTPVDMLAELSRREAAANIKPDLDLDVYMKVRDFLHIFLETLEHELGVLVTFILL